MSKYVNDFVDKSIQVMLGNKDLMKLKEKISGDEMKLTLMLSVFVVPVEEDGTCVVPIGSSSSPAGIAEQDIRFVSFYLKGFVKSINKTFVQDFIRDNKSNKDVVTFELDDSYKVMCAKFNVYSLFQRLLVTS